MPVFMILPYDNTCRHVCQRKISISTYKMSCFLQDEGNCIEKYGKRADASPDRQCDPAACGSVGDSDAVGAGKLCKADAADGGVHPGAERADCSACQRCFLRISRRPSRPLPIFTGRRRLAAGAGVPGCVGGEFRFRPDQVCESGRGEFCQRREDCRCGRPGLFYPRRAGESGAAVIMQSHFDGTKLIGFYAPVRMNGGDLRRDDRFPGGGDSVGYTGNRCVRAIRRLR